ncbi:hypothetical protein EK21DRAFT_75499 [Setomelanomma holmii]|uniref:Zn(2)-C6 fungal-type domain-containing protein n=1 Tax=Setomelanomma holmii TaxID=210430 RepID=A0A9P4LIS2_9PLEO|nr:hypothetical protein EK21DRAFT_75499 [Setomelanomma holmii]
MSSAYPEPDAQTYVNHNGTPPAQQQQQHMTDPELRLQENLQQLRDGGEMMHTGNPQQPQYQQLAQMPPTMSAHHHFQSPARPVHSPQQMAHAVMSLEGQHDPYDPNDPSRKRSKVSRACDECRRKKIRCDATSENGPESCSSCKRTGARCQFSRQPMKRGPSKGYIKELADRLNSLESQIQHPPSSSNAFDFGGIGDPNFANTQSPPNFVRKRTHSMTDEFQDVFSRPSWTTQDRGNTYPPEENAPSVLTHEELPLNGNRRTSFGEMIGNLVTGSHEDILKAYANVIHPTLPILPHDSSALNRLTHCPSKLREAFFLSLEASIRAAAPRALPQTELSLNQLLLQSVTAVDAAKHTLHDADISRQFFNSLVYCQSLILLALASDRPGPTTVGSTAQVLGQLAGCINDAGLNDARTLNVLKEQDREIYMTARQVFWTAFILDRFHASAHNKDIMLPLHSSGLSRDDFSALGGDVGYHLARAAEIVGQLAFLERAGSMPNLDSTSPFAFSMLSGTSPNVIFLNGQLNGFRESIDITDLVSSSPPHLTYQYLRLVAARSLAATAQSAELLSITKELLNRLLHGTITPLHHFFATLVATSLTELSERLETQVEAHASIREMSDALSNGHIIHRSSDGLGWDDALRDLLHKKRAHSPQPNATDQNVSMLQPNMAGLQHLAAAAVGEREGSEARPASSGGNGNATHQSKIDHDLSAAMAAANEAAKAQATAAAAQQLSASPNGNAGNNFDSSGLTKDWS